MENGKAEQVKPVSLYKAVLILVAVILGLAFIYFTLDILIIFVIAFLVGYALNPIITFFESKGVPRAISVFGVLVLLIGILTVAFYFLIPAMVDQVVTLARQIPSYSDTVKSWWDRIASLNPYLKENFDFNIIARQFQTSITQTIQSLILAATSIASFLLAFVLVMVIAFFGLVSPAKIKDSALQLIPLEYKEKTVSIFRQIHIKIGSYLRGVLLSGLLIGVLSIAGYSLLGVNFALTLGIIAGILELVPLIGPIIAGVIAVAVAIFQDPILAIYVAIFAFALQQFENHFIIPNIMSRQVGLHPVTVIFATLVMAKFLGIVGIFLAVPLAAIIKILINEIYKPNIREKS